MERFYKYGFYTLLSILLVIVGLILYNNNISSGSTRESANQIEKTLDEKAEIQRSFDNTVARLDSVTASLDSSKSLNNVLLGKLEIKNPKDSIVRSLTEKQRRMLRLIDSTNMLRDSINRIGEKMIDLQGDVHLDKASKNSLRNGFAVLGDISLSLNFALDNQQLELLRQNATSLNSLVGTFNKKVDKLNRFSKMLESFTKYLGTAIDVFGAAVSQGILTPKGAALSSK